jgi:hypothetical protein
MHQKCDEAKLTLELRNGWTRFLISLMIRTPHMVAEIGRQAEKNLRHNLLLKPEEYEAVRTKNSPPTLLAWAEKHAPAVFGSAGKTLLPELTNNQKIGDALIQMKWWTILVTHESLDLLTCDNPYHMTHGLGDDRCLVVLPLSPCFVFFATRQAERVNAIMSQKPEVFISALNDAIVRQAQNYVYGSNGRHKRFVENRLRYE